MLRDLLFVIMLFVSGFTGVLSCKTKKYKNRSNKITAFVILSMIFCVEAAYTVLLLCGNRLPNEKFWFFAFMCALANTAFVLLNGNKGVKRAGIVIAAFFAVFTMYFMCFISQEEIVVNDRVYIGEYESVTGTSKTLVKCYEKRNSVFTENNYSLILDYGIVLGDKVDFSHEPYEIKEIAQ